MSEAKKLKSIRMSTKTESQILKFEEGKSLGAKLENLVEEYYSTEREDYIKALDEKIDAKKKELRAFGKDLMKVRTSVDKAKEQIADIGWGLQRM